MIVSQKLSQAILLALIMFVFVSVPNIAYCQNATTLSESGGGHWSYRANIILTESIGLARDNEPVELIFKSDKVKPQGEDIRITDTNGNELPCQVDTTSNGTYKIYFFAKCNSNSSNIYYLYFGNQSAGMPRYEPTRYILDNQSKSWHTDGVFIGWGGMAGFNVAGVNAITTLKFDNNLDKNPLNDPDMLTDEYAWAPFYGYLGPDIRADQPHDFGSSQAQVIEAGPVFCELSLGNARIRHYKDLPWIMANQHVDGMFCFDRNYQFMKNGLNSEISVPNFGSNVNVDRIVGYDSSGVNPEYLAFRNPINGLVFGAVAKNVARWQICAKPAGAWDRIISFDDSSNLPNAKIYWYADTSNNYDGIEKFSKQVLNPLKVELQVDTEPPVTTISATPEKPDGLNDWYVTQPKITLSVSENAEAYYRIDNGAWLSYSGPIDISDGFHELSYYSVDSFGNAEQAKTIEIKVDTRPPLASSSVSPTDNQLTNNPTLTFSWSPAIDSGSGLSHYDLYIDGSIAISNIDSSATTITSPKLNDGSHTWFIRVYDKAGNYSDSVTSSFLIDTTPPETSAYVSPASPDGANGWYVSLPSINLSANEASAIYFKLDSCDYRQYDSTITVTEGNHKIYYYSIDQAGNREGEKSLELRVDCSLPDIEASLLPQRVDDHYRLGEDIVFSYNATDSISGVESITAIVNGVPVLNGASLSFSKPGRYTLTVTAADFAGNKITKTLNFTVGYDFKWLPPIQRRHGLKEPPYQVKYNSTLPIKFSVYDYSGNFISDTSVKVIISDGVNSQTFDYGEGKGFVKINPSDENYLLNLHFKDCPLIKPGGCYTISVYFSGVDPLPGTLAGQIKLSVVADDRKPGDR
ncbi:MAG: hypothetical protein K6T91_09415 [Firmicutes bacterium]|nr:hypothetical protein [Bacillota bacterium]